MSTPNAGPSAPSYRLHALDALRGVALTLGVVLHASMAYMPGAKYYWLASDPQQSVAAALLFYFIHLSRMTLFFLIAGFFGRLAWERLGPAAFARNRARRILLPLVAGWPLVMTAIVMAILLVTYIKTNGQMPATSPKGPTFMPDDFPLGHLWFLYVLLWFYLAAAGLRALGSATGLLERGLMQRIDAAMRRLGGWYAPMLLAIPLATAFALQSQWYMWFGVPTPDQSLYPSISAIAAFGTAFAFGWLLQRQMSIVTQWAKHCVVLFAMAIIATSICLAIVGLAPDLKPAANDAQRYAYGGFYAVASWAWTLAWIGLAWRLINREHRALRYLSDGSYWVYLVHLPIVVALQGVMLLLNWPWYLKLAAVVLGTMTVALLSYQWLVRATWLGAALNGRRIQGRSGA